MPARDYDKMRKVLEVYIITGMNAAETSRQTGVQRKQIERWKESPQGQEMMKEIQASNQIALNPPKKKEPKQEKEDKDTPEPKSMKGKVQEAMMAKMLDALSEPDGNPDMEAQTDELGDLKKKIIRQMNKVIPMTVDLDLLSRALKAVHAVQLSTAGGDLSKRMTGKAFIQQIYNHVTVNNS